MNMVNKTYSTEKELLIHGKKLLNKTLFDLYGEKSKKQFGGGKGTFGNKVEELHYGIKNNNLGEPDIKNLGIEIKTSPLKVVFKGTKISPAQRVTLSLINFDKIILEDFETSQFLTKNRRILYNMFLSDVDNDFDYRFLIIDLIEPTESDLKIIKQDWEYIKKSVVELRANSLSQKDTLYLCAATKGDKNQKDITYSNGKAKAKRRSYSYKSSYIAHYLNQYVLQRKNGSYFLKKKKSNTISLFKEKSKKSFENLIIESFTKYIGKSDVAISKSFGEQKMFEIGDNKARWHFNTSLILTGKKKKYLSKYIEEFSKSGLTVKTVRLNRKNELCEQVSFRTQGYGNLVDCKWEDSSLFNEMTNPFLWVIYKEDSINNNQYNLFNAFLWKMPIQDLRFLKKKWNELKQLISQGDYRHEYFQSEQSFYFLKIKDKIGGKNKIFEDQKITNLSHWFRKNYVEKIIKKSISR